MPKTGNVRKRTKPLLKRGADLPNEATKRALQQARSRKGLEKFETFAEWAKTVRNI
jgi:hypothetical protein